ncbi:unnamed protein product [Ceutorhynchus assimilis]|uniref:ADP-ribosyl cyclase/cyclic ADP-ribose hydrolase n=1 Tax=Ceutorhynchus assimilis TaxID=467358 RepID=A0A9N9N006_9CUCU|nr:unnamed protein product [Ceutorhynchus assimilis]
MSSKETTLVLLLLVFSVQCDQILDFKVITAVRHGIENALNYIESNLYRSMVDVTLGVAFVKAFMKDSYKNGSHIMDPSSLRIMNRCDNVLAKASQFFSTTEENGSDWKFKNLIYNDIWTKSMDYKPKNSLKTKKNPDKISPQIIFYRENYSDHCIFEIVNATNQKDYRQCPVSRSCWDTFYKNAKGNGYFLTHKLLILQIAKARKCIINAYYYKKQVTEICTFIKYDATYYTGSQDEKFDLFLEQILLCGYEGFTDFIRNDWLFRILKSQRDSGCFKDKLLDKNKSRIKRDAVLFEDGCSDHTTTLGAGVLGLYYNYIIKKEFIGM